MRKLAACIIVFLGFISVSGQVISSSKWTDFFSYNNVIAIREDNGKLIAATENGLFYYTISTGEISKLSKANGLHEVKISAFDYNPETQTGLVGYENGSMDVITPQGIVYVVDIPIATGYDGDKKINHISISGNQAAISISYGVSIFNLDRKEFVDTSFFTTGAGYVAAKESVIFDGKVFSATESGLKMHEIDVTFPIYSTWSTVASGDFSQIVATDVLAFSDANSVRYGDGLNFTTIGGFTAIQDLVLSDGNLVVADQTSVKVYNNSSSLLKTHDFGEQLNTAIDIDGQTYAGTLLSGIKNESDFTFKPDGPYSNTSYTIDVYRNQIVISSGGKEAYNDPIFNNLGYYHFNGTSWTYPSFFLTTMKLNVLDAVIDRNNPNQVFFINYTPFNGQKGLYRMENGEFKNRYISVDAYLTRLGGLAFDEDKNLFASVSSIPGNPEQIGFYYYNSASDSFVLKKVISAGGVQKPFTNEGILYIPAPYNGNGGMLLYDYNNTPANSSDDSFKLLNTANGLPANGTVSGDIDENGDLWIGTRLGLRVISNPQSVISEDNPQTQPIVIEENNVGEELFRDNTILKITHDSGNQKWISVDGGGVFYLSASGEQTYLNFTRANSPIPNNSVTDIKVDDATGKVYFVTSDGVVIYQGDVVNSSENFGDVLVYPNPVVHANYKGNVKIRGLAETTNIRITDAAGNLVHQAVARGGFYEWNLANFRGVRVASGIYYVLMTNADGTDTATAKIAVVN